MIILYKQNRLMHDFAIYMAQYEEVITEAAENIGERMIQGLEYKLRYSFPGLLPTTDRAVEGHFYYTFTRSISKQYYDHNDNEWKDGKTTLGDISPHKLQTGLFLPITNNTNLYLSGKWVGRRRVYTRNVLRPLSGFRVPSYAVFNANLSMNWRYFSLDFKVNNILDKRYLQPGVENANSGNDFDNRSLGYQNSMIPGPSRAMFLILTSEF